MQRWTKWAVKGLAGVAMTIGFMAGTARTKAQDTTEPTPTKLSAAPPVTYANRYELYGGINLQNFQAGQDLPKRMNFGGVELLGTYWITPRWGAALNFRGEAGTTPVFANPYTTRPLVVMYEGMAGAEYRGPKGQRAAMNFHAYAGVGGRHLQRYAAASKRNGGALYQSRQTDGGDWDKLRLQPVEGDCDSAVTGFDPGALWDGDA